MHACEAVSAGRVKRAIAGAFRGLTREQEPWLGPNPQYAYGILRSYAVLHPLHSIATHRKAKPRPRRARSAALGGGGCAMLRCSDSESRRSVRQVVCNHPDLKFLNLAQSGPQWFLWMKLLLLRGQQQTEP